MGHSSDYNSYSSSLKEKIFGLINESEIELAPVEIAKKIGANHSSVRVYIRQLTKEGKILSPYHGVYCNKITYGMIFNPVRVHNLVVTASVDVDESGEVVEVVGTVKVRVLFGFQRKKVSIFVSCDAGMDKNACLLALHRGFDIVKAKLGKDIDDVTVRTFEANRDYAGVRLDREQCLTKKGLFDVIERIYQKEDVVRHEFKVAKEMSLTEFEALLQGGVSSYNITQANYALIQEVRKLADALKMTNSQLLEQSRVLEGVVKWIYRQNGEKK